ncbi:hypothetical protein NFI96_010753, partial [Prochilodus magdalenae]
NFFSTVLFGGQKTPYTNTKPSSHLCTMREGVPWCGTAYCIKAWTSCTMYAKAYQSILQEYVRAAAHDLMLKTCRMMQQDNDLKHTSKSTKKWRPKVKHGKEEDTCFEQASQVLGQLQKTLGGVDAAKAKSTGY